MYPDRAMLLGALVYLVFFTLFPIALAEWWTVEWDATEFTAMSGDMIVPDVPNPPGTPTGTWWIGDGYYGTPSPPWGAGFNAYPGNTVHFEFAVDSSGNWTCTLSGPSFAQTILSLPGLTMNRAILAVELYDVDFNFGPVIYRNVTITATTAASDWCGTTGSLGYTSGVNFSLNPN
ncbi:hypothetical protein EW145_g1651 [Phellinidium pouzarii]|uniref:Ubiquitin 3 binding protein But2 C-terminal domain-containing protein n=1 Tax=Phellinidium pouzarii TaxID=167371 RepID=A0A4S4LE65_9AGAM|nr:hypothetical protein EW145_g1651 [Phellinidium pouzarii]